MKNIITSIFTLTLLLVFCFSCNDFTDVGLPKSQITRDVVFKDDELAKSAMAGVYRSLEETGFLSGSQNGAQVILSAYVDELQSYAVATNDVSIFYSLSHTASSTGVSNLWTTTYTQIYYINSVIEGVENSAQISAAVKNKLKGEALFVRALLHLYLAQTFGPVPFVDTTDYQINQTIGKSSVAEIYAKCKADLDASVLLLPDTLAAGSRTYPTKMAAYAVLARIAYYENNWDAALQYSNLVINNTQYKMDSDLSKAFLKDSSGSIWHLLPYNTTASTYQGNIFILNTAPPTYVALRQDFVDGFEAGDKRKTSWVGQKNDSQGKVYYFPYKYKQYTAGASSLEYSVVLRVEELYLIRAEAYINKGQYNLAVSDVNAVRVRAGLTALGAVTDQVFLKNALIKERRSEMFTEFGHRFYDLKHFQQLDQVMAAKKAAWKSNFAYLPLPEKELLLNPNLNPQNNGY
jgi:hypothetical protein